MSKQSALKHVVEVKTALAEKHQRLALMRKSKPGKATLLRHAERYRQQAANAAKRAERLS